MHSSSPHTHSDLDGGVVCKLDAGTRVWGQCNCLGALKNLSIGEWQVRPLSEVLKLCGVLSRTSVSYTSLKSALPLRGSQVQHVPNTLKNAGRALE